MHVMLATRQKRNAHRNVASLMDGMMYGIVVLLLRVLLSFGHHVHSTCGLVGLDARSMFHWSISGFRSIVHQTTLSRYGTCVNVVECSLELYCRVDLLSIVGVSHVIECIISSFK